MFPPSPPLRQILTVSELTGLVRAAIETNFSEIWLEGEISNLRAPASGHLYLTLKDESSQIRAVLFKGVAGRLRFALEDGLQVVARGRVTVYEPRGEYQIILDSVEPKGRGALQVAFEQLKARLEAEGLFEADRKRPLPEWPRAVGVVTSLSGAALRDVLTVLHRRCPTLRIIIVPVQVQGEGSAEQIAAAITMLGDSGLVDVMIVGRGGGSLEDLWSFNEEMVVRAIVASRVPVVSAVGHETDVTLADFAADLRAPTPSAAAEAVAPVLAQIVSRLAELTARLQQSVTRRTEEERQRLRLATHQMAAVRYRIQEEMQRVDAALFGMTAAVRLAVQAGQDRLQLAERSLLAGSPETIVRHGLAVVPQLLTRLHRGMRGEMAARMQRVHACLGNLHTLSPLATLGRGYSILRHVPSGSVVRRVEDVTVGEDLQAQFVDGQALCTVKAVQPDHAV
ncbi:MAG: exodeoxyribonuclease VII large subunit [Nitrospira sp.]|jgi:exodeoxyribonuclease VII large subunit|nr:exodeoxyribonuclease VII large subunit [Nitrospira sp.]